MPCPVALLSTLYDVDHTLLDFLLHYRALGVEDCYLLVNQDYPAAALPAIVEQSGMRVHALRGTLSHPAAFSINAWENALRRLIAHPWVMPADLDELHELPFSLAEVEKQLVGFDFLAGSLYDRLHPQGWLPPVSPGRMWEQFSAHAPLTALLGAGTEKVLLQRRDCWLKLGHHAVGQLRGRPRRSPQRGQTHHFKWHAALEKKMRERYQSYRQAGLNWAGESLRALELLTCLPQLPKQAVASLPCPTANPSPIPGELHWLEPSWFWRLQPRLFLGVRRLFHASRTWRQSLRRWLRRQAALRG